MDQSKKNGLWVLGSVMMVMAFFAALIIIGVKFTSAVKEEAADAVTPVECTCSCPQTKCTSGQGMVIDGYNVTVALDGTTKWLPPSLNPEESGYVVLCRREDPELVDHPDYTMTKLYNYFHQCIDELAMVRAGYDDDVNQCCWQENSFELPLPEPIRVPHKMTEAEWQEELNSLVGPNGEKYR
jgi:hypothetical protein